VRLCSPAITCLLLAGAAAFACSSPAIEGDDLGVPLPERITPTPTRDATTVDAPVVVQPRDAAAPDAAPVDAYRELHAFVSSSVISSSLGGLAGADMKCTSLAAAQGLKGTYRAWLSINGSNAATRITSAGPWRLVTGKLVAATHAQLVSGQLSRPLNKDEKGVIAPVDEDRVWTGTAPDGTFSGPECGLWSGAGSGRVGEAEFSDSRWSSSTTEACDQVNRVYCFEL